MNEYRQMTIFDLLPPEIKPGQWVKDHGPRVMFDNIIPGRMYIEEAGSPQYMRAVRVIRIANGIVFETDGSPVAHDGHMMTRREYIDGEPGGWMYEVPTWGN